MEEDPRHGQRPPHRATQPSVTTLGFIANKKMSIGTYIRRPFQLLSQMRRTESIAFRKSLADSDSSTDRRGVGEYKPPKQYDKDGNELRRKVE